VRFETDGRAKAAGRRRRQRAVAVGVTLPDTADTAEPPLAELKRLAETAGAHVVGELVQRRPRPDATYFVGKGKAEQAAALARELEADVILFDNDLSPAQERNLEKLIGRSICDRSRLILDIFATRARTKQAALQVELAQLEYQKPRLKRMWTHLERMEGAIGSRGPGEKQIEEDKRIIGKRIAGLKRELAVVERQRESRAASRAAFFKVSLVGYTNAGKSTLLSRLTGADAFIEDKLFATLDTQTRAWELPGNQRVFLSDTVGFIRDLPHHLVASFRSTLAEAVEADLLLHVVDASNPDAELQMRVVEETLDAIGAGANPRLVVFNKIDAVKDRILADALVASRPGAVGVSGRTGAGVPELEKRVARIARGRHRQLEIEVPAGAGRLLAFIEERADVVEKSYDGDVVRLRLVASERDAAKIESQLLELGGA
jgi:GTPase